MSAAARDAPRLPFEQSARAALEDATMRANVLRATTTIRARRAAAVADTPDWPELRAAGEALRQRALLRLDELLVRLEAAVTAAGGVVHWARDAAEANALVVDLVSATGEHSVVKVKSLTTDEIGLNDALAAAGIEPIETDLAERIVQLAGERPSHLLVPSLHRGRPEIAELLLPEALLACMVAGMKQEEVEALFADFSRNQIPEWFLRVKRTSGFCDCAREAFAEHATGCASLVTINPGERLEYNATVSTRDFAAGQEYTVDGFFPTYDMLRSTVKLVPTR